MVMPYSLAPFPPWPELYLAGAYCPAGMTVLQLLDRLSRHALRSGFLRLCFSLCFYSRLPQASSLISIVRDPHGPCSPPGTFLLCCCGPVILWKVLFPPDPGGMGFWESLSLFTHCPPNVEFSIYHKIILFFFLIHPACFPLLLTSLGYHILTPNYLPTGPLLVPCQ